jgi:Transposase IS116/IS110/IS902 family
VLCFGRKDFSDTLTIDAKSLEERIDREQGVSKAGNPRLRTTLIQLAWLWLRHQPQSALALWFKERVVRNRGRLKKAAIAAPAKIARGALEICGRRRRHRGSHNESRLM